MYESKLEKTSLADKLISSTDHAPPVGHFGVISHKHKIK